jgi:hypothetical protein
MAQLSAGPSCPILSSSISYKLACALHVVGMHGVVRQSDAMRHTALEVDGQQYQALDELLVNVSVKAGSQQRINGSHRQKCYLSTSDWMIDEPRALGTVKSS